ncbi:MAG: hypothetical protein GF411_07140 [Candidatus Lokiarchaeota archaeon]|nr:hypothetical protein [Candidatus Lokiarchaeota archaeon]
MNEIICPKCKEKDVRTDMYLKKTVSYEGETPIYSIPCVCRSCGHEWDQEFRE